MPNTYVEIETAALESFLINKGFHRHINNSEIVYRFPHKREPKLFVQIYTSIRVGAESVRGCGQDAIRVVTILDNGKKTYPIGKFTSIHRKAPNNLPHDKRVEIVLERMAERAREAYKRGTEWLNERNAKYLKREPA